MREDIYFIENIWFEWVIKYDDFIEFNKNIDNIIIKLEDWKIFELDLRNFFYKDWKEKMAFSPSYINFKEIIWNEKVKKIIIPDFLKDNFGKSYKEEKEKEILLVKGYTFTSYEDLMGKNND